MTSHERRKELLARFLDEVWSQGRIEHADRYVAPHYTLRHDPGDPWAGMTLDLEGYKDRVRRSRAPVPDQCFEVQEMFADDAAVVVSWLWHGTHQGEMAGFAPTGRVIRMSGMTIYYFDAEDRLTGHWQMVDRLGVFQQLAASKVGSSLSGRKAV